MQKEALLFVYGLLGKGWSTHCPSPIVLPNEGTHATLGIHSGVYRYSAGGHRIYKSLIWKENWVEIPPSKWLDFNWVSLPHDERKDKLELHVRTHCCNHQRMIKALLKLRSKYISTSSLINLDCQFELLLTPKAHRLLSVPLKCISPQLNIKSPFKPFVPSRILLGHGRASQTQHPIFPLFQIISFFPILY